MTQAGRIVNLAIVLFALTVLGFVLTTAFFAPYSVGPESSLLATVVGILAVGTALIVFSGWHEISARAYGFVIVTALFVAFWIAMLWPAIATWWANR
jgi:hypothetical protein